MSTDSINQARGMVYGLLSSLFAKEIDHQLLHELTSEKAKAFWTQLASESAFKQDVDAMVKVLENLKSDKALMELAADYCGLFLVGTKHSASPYASLYLQDTSSESQDEPTLFGEQHQLMVQFLKQSQLQVQTSFPEPADHLAVILAYVEHLCKTTDDTEQLKFIESYLAIWLGNFAAKVTQCDSGEFYCALARLTQSWVEADLKGLREEV
ncbi:molecular chaperone TorD [Shewanella eurypsychrophilus]|uniref:Chaperone protein TorD n=1 Tax=Shewanella eurypsychrophilus TaxID=2593656 RepID=A0ABX6VFR4_9GAMM|nr:MULTISPECIES: molecular chaperone TorD [Shewanella]QFU25405.1 molecular chaperone TorD [Shewanella sp. YLB-09]QPG60548.1 molecular chaperone TorD [Shewanella eurypsychrophilus]